jgi:hypothetical protein
MNSLDIMQRKRGMQKSFKEKNTGYVYTWENGRNTIVKKY